MHLIPAIDIQNGKTVRLFQGKREELTVYEESPLAMAKRWASEGATWLHIVDLDGAFEGTSQNEPLIEEILRTVPLSVEVGGGIRDREKARRLFQYGASRVIVGTKAIEDRAFLESLAEEFPEKILVGVDARDGFVTVKGWTEKRDLRAEDFLSEISVLPLAGVVYTDIARDGALQGPNLTAIHRVVDSTSLPVIASGGVTTLEDLRSLAKIPLFGVIIGKALYECRIHLREALRLLATS